MRPEVVNIFGGLQPGLPVPVADGLRRRAAEIVGSNLIGAWMSVLCVLRVVR